MPRAVALVEPPRDPSFPSPECCFRRLSPALQAPQSRSGLAHARAYAEVLRAYSTDTRAGARGGVWGRVTRPSVRTREGRLFGEGVTAGLTGGRVGFMRTLLGSNVRAKPHPATIIDRS